MQMGDDLDTVKSIFRRILWANKGHLTCEEILGEYRRCTGETFCCTNYGYSSLKDFLETLTDVVIIQRGSNDEILLRSVDDGASSRILKLIENQRYRRQILRKKNTSSERQSSTDCATDIKTDSTESKSGRGKEILHGVQEIFSGGATKPITSSQTSLGHHQTVPKMAHSTQGRGRGRGRGMQLREALATAINEGIRGSPGTSQNIATTPQLPSGEVPDEHIKEWIIKELTTKHGGIWANKISSLFEEHFKMSTPHDLLAKIRLWSDVIETEKLLPGDIFKLRRRGPEKHEESKSQESTQDKCSNSEKSTSPEDETVPQAAESDLSVHNEGTNRTGELKTVIAGPTPPGNPAEASTNPSNETSVPEKFMKIWIRRELSPKPDGVSVTEIPTLFEKNFNRPPPPNLLAKVESWSDMIQISIIDTGKILRLKRRENIVQKAEHAKPQEYPHESSSSTEQSTSSENCAVSPAGSTPDAHVEGSKNSEKLDSRSVISGSTSYATETSSDPSGQPIMSDMSIKMWIVKELSHKPNGIWAKGILSMFEKNFNRPAPFDLLAKLQSWSDVIDTLPAAGGNILTLKRQIQQMQKAESKQAKPQNPAQVRNSNSRTPEVDTIGLKKVAIPEEGLCFCVHVEWSNSPGDFCIIPLEILESLRTMGQELNTYFQSQNKVMKPMQDSSLEPSKLYAGKYNSSWYRAIIKGRIREDNTIQTWLPDFCFETALPIDHLAELPPRFHSLPLCGIKASLYGVSPADGSQWSKKIIQDFWTIVNGRDFVCLVREKDVENNITTVNLIDTSDDDDVIVDEILDELIYTQRVEFGRTSAEASY